MSFCLICGKKHENKSFYCSIECEEIDREYKRIVKEIQKRENFLEKVDDRDIDPCHSLEQQKAEDEKYERYEKELAELREQAKKLRKKFAEIEMVI